MDTEIGYRPGSRLLVGAGGRWLLVDVAFPPSTEAERRLSADLWSVASSPDALQRWRAVLERHGAAERSHAALDLSPGVSRTSTQGSGRIEQDGDQRVLTLDEPDTSDEPDTPRELRSPAHDGVLVAGTVGARSARIGVRPGVAGTATPARGIPAVSAPAAARRAPSAGVITAIPADVLASRGPAVPPGAGFRAVGTADPPADLPGGPRPSTRDLGSTVVRRDLPPPSGPALTGPPAPPAPAEPPAPAVPAGPEVLGCLCALGHANPPTRQQCLFCGAPVNGERPRLLPRPALGCLRLPGGEQVPLDRGVVLGRHPAGSPALGPAPHLVQLPPDSTYLSRVHLQIAIEGWLVLARDLGSRAGTTRYVPNRPAERLRAGEDYVLEPGHVLDLADVYEVSYEMIAASESTDPGGRR